MSDAKDEKKKDPQTEDIVIAKVILTLLQEYIKSKTAKDESTSAKRKIAQTLFNSLSIIFNGRSKPQNDALILILTAIENNRLFVAGYNKKLSFFQHSISLGTLEATLIECALLLIQSNYKKYIQDNLNRIKLRIGEDSEKLSKEDIGRFEVKVNDTPINPSQPLEAQLISAGITNKNQRTFIANCMNQQCLGPVLSGYKNLLMFQLTSAQSTESVQLRSMQQMPQIYLQKPHTIINLIPEQDGLRIDVSTKHQLFDVRLGEMLGPTLTENRALQVTNAAINSIIEKKLSGTSWAWANVIEGEITFSEPEKLSINIMQTLLFPLCASPELRASITPVSSGSPISPRANSFQPLTPTSSKSQATLAKTHERQGFESAPILHDELKTEDLEQKAKLAVIHEHPEVSSVLVSSISTTGMSSSVSGSCSSAVVHPVPISITDPNVQQQAQASLTNNKENKDNKDSAVSTPSLT